jgi:HK97 family phage portal protein
VNLRNLINGLRRWLNKATANTLTTMRHPAGATGWLLLNRTSINYEKEVTPEASSIVIACVRWVQRVFSEAPMMLQQWLEDRAEWEDIHRDEVLSLLELPNPFYSGTTLIKATVADLMLDGNAYWIKVRSRSGRVVQLWWAPHSIVTAKGDPTKPTVFIDHYEYSPSTNIGKAPLPLRVEDVIHFRDGIDPVNVRRGLSPIKSLFREIFTDDEAANMTASLLRNMGVPGVIIAPKTGSIPPEAAARIKEEYMERFSGDSKGQPLVLGGDATVQQFGFSPQQMELRGIRGIPEERITAVLGVNAAVVGLGAGLATTKVGATLREYREEAFESTIIPMYREIAAELTQQLLGDFRDPESYRFAFDITKIRVLQEDEMKRAQRITNLVTQGLLRVAEGRRVLGWPVLPEHEIYLRPVNLVVVPAGVLPSASQPDEGDPDPDRDAAKALTGGKQRALADQSFRGRTNGHGPEGEGIIPTPAPRKVVKTVERDGLGRISRVIEESPSGFGT